MRVRIQEPSGTTWKNVDQSYYRYYKSGDSNGFVHGLKYVVEPDGYAEMLADGIEPTSASGAVLLQYSKYYFQYNADRRVTQEIVDRGSLTFNFSYTTSSHADDENFWRRKTVETRPDGSTETVYTNHIGQVLLSELASGSDRWITVRKYNQDARLIELAHPSVVLGYDEAAADLNVSLRPDEGLIELTGYYSTTGGVAAAGYPESTSLKHGENGTPVPQSRIEYTSRTANGTTVYPVSKQIQYRNDDGSGAIDTSFSYTWHTGTVQVEQQTITLPTVPTSQNGAGTTDTPQSVFDQYGNLTWRMDPRGFITRLIYDIPTGALVQRIEDADTSLLSGVPSGWSTPSGGGQHLVTDYEIDLRGRTTQTLGPAHTVDLDGTATTVRRADWTVYQDIDHATWTASGYATGSPPSYSYTLINPVTIQRYDPKGNLIEQIEATRGTTSGRLQPTDTFSRSSYTRWSTWQYTDCCLLSAARVYHTIPATGEGTSGTNYDETTYGYDSMKRRNREISPGGAITRMVHDVRDNLIAVYVGTNDNGATAADPTGGGAAGNNMVRVNAMQYDNGNDGGDGNRTQGTADIDALNTRITNYSFDWRNRQVDIDGEIDYFQRSTYDNLNQVITTERYDTTASGNLISRNETKFDDRRQVYRTIRWGVDPSTGSVGNSLTSNFWYDAAGNQVKSLPGGSGGQFTKQVFNGAGWKTATYIGFGDDATYSDVLDVSGDVILQQTETEHDDAGNVIQTTVRQRYHNAPASQTGALGDTSTAPNARVSYAATYSDPLGRRIATADYGTNGGSSLSRPATIPASSGTVLVSREIFNDAGEMQDSVDPSGKIMRTIFDAAGRQMETIDNYVEATPSSSSSSSSGCAASADRNQTTQFSYNADGNLKTLTVVNAQTGDQVTQYVYGTTLAESGIASSQLLKAEIYPDSAGPLDQVSYTYNRQSERTSLTDQNGTVRQFDYDALGRRTQDRVTTLGVGVDGSVRRIEQSYDVRGNVDRVTSFDSATVGTGTIVNEITRTFNDFAQTRDTYQSHDGAVNVSSSPSVGHTYAAGGSGNTIRPTSILYPSGREITVDYGAASSISDAVGQVASLIDDDTGQTHLADYQYLGLTDVVQQDSPQADLRYTLVSPTLTDDPNTGDIYAGLDRFGRVDDLRWRNTSSDTDLSRVPYGYDRAGNRTWRENLSDPNRRHDWLYRYDQLHRLHSADRGQLNSGHTAIQSDQFAQCWTLDATGNWQGFQQDDDGNGSWDVVQSRDANQVNEITDITSTSGAAWATPAYDQNGNTTTIPRPDLGAGATMSATYDAWNRMTKLVDNSTSQTLQEYAYDGRNFRILAREYSGGTLEATRHYYFTDNWQCLEEHLDSSIDPARQYVWGIRYIDDLVLRDRDTGAGGPLGERLYFLQDANWNTTAVVDASGSVQERYEYDPYGTLSFFAADFTPRSTSSYDIRYSYTGREWTPAAGLYYFRNRMYDAKLERLCSRDPIGYEGSPWSLQAYAGNDPLTRTDPTGLWWDSCTVEDAQRRRIPRPGTRGRIRVLRLLCKIKCKCYDGSSEIHYAPDLPHSGMANAGDDRARCQELADLLLPEGPCYHLDTYRSTSSPIYRSCYISC